jgi:hypothetical protein
LIALAFRAASGAVFEALGTVRQPQRLASAAPKEGCPEQSTAAPSRLNIQQNQQQQPNKNGGQ